ncbi:DUF4406 domain-containing protein [Uliginosibacterium sediminicola]|uniref:DUF4406 domain-containing protein n=1 Tax=Uliginosibacterium sediminicola TaxID=2024550 RepID=A0ABU9YWH2_9RHOO
MTGEVLYLSGPMTGLPGFNYPAFNAEAARLRALGYTVENPAENPEPTCKSWAGYMRIGLLQLLRCNVIVLLPGWQGSRGARIERFIARILDMRIVYAGEI